MPTRAEIRIAAAKRLERDAQAALSRAYEKKRAAIEAVTRKHLPLVWKAEKRVYAARVAVTNAELAAHGIEAMKTIIECSPAFSRKRGRFVVRVNPRGYARLLQVGKKGAILVNRNEQPAPLRWDHACVTGETLKGADHA